MVTYERAYEVLRDRVSDVAWYDHCAEFENAFVFSRYDDLSIGGNGPCAVMKDDGEACNFVAVMDELGDMTGEYSVAPDGTRTIAPPGDKGDKWGLCHDLRH